MSPRIYVSTSSSVSGFVLYVPVADFGYNAVAAHCSTGELMQGRGTWEVWELTVHSQYIVVHRQGISAIMEPVCLIMRCQVARLGVHHRLSAVAERKPKCGHSVLRP